ncbi:hypothetical protein MTO96_051268 [Rhipicephalus appendiculatus]
MNASVPANASTTSGVSSERFEAAACRSEAQPLPPDVESLDVKSANKDVTADAVIATSTVPDQRQSQGVLVMRAGYFEGDIVTPEFTDAGWDQGPKLCSVLLLFPIRKDENRCSPMSLR